MSDTWQYIIVGVVVAGALALSLRSIIRVIQHKKSALNPCNDCSLKNNCNKTSNNCDFSYK